MKLFSSIAIALIAILSLGACTDNPDFDDGREKDPLIIGAWTNDSIHATFQFLDNGNYTLSVADHPSSSLRPEYTLSSPLSSKTKNRVASFPLKNEEGIWWTVRDFLNLLRKGNDATTYRYKIQNDTLLLWPTDQSMSQAVPFKRI